MGSRSEVIDQRIGIVHQPGDVDSVRCRPTTAGKARGGAAKQRGCTLAVAPLDMSDAHRELGQALPHCLLVGRAALPRGLEHLVSVECEASVQQILGIGKGLGRCQRQVVRNPWHACTTRREWSAQSVSRSGVTRAAGFVTITLGHLPIMTSDGAQSATATEYCTVGIRALRHRYVHCATRTWFIPM